MLPKRLSIDSKSGRLINIGICPAGTLDKIRSPAKNGGLHERQKHLKFLFVGKRFHCAFPYFQPFDRLLQDLLCRAGHHRSRPAVRISLKGVSVGGARRLVLAHCTGYSIQEEVPKVVV